MPARDRVAEYAEELTAICRDLHAHPERGFEEIGTPGIVADKLKSWGIEISTGFGKRGIVGTIKGTRLGRTIGLHADIDALPIHEQTNLPYASKTPGVMHACGHDGHTTMLPGGARAMAGANFFDITVTMPPAPKPR